MTPEDIKTLFSPEFPIYPIIDDMDEIKILNAKLDALLGALGLEFEYNKPVLKRGYYSVKKVKKEKK